MEGVSCSVLGSNEVFMSEGYRGKIRRWSTETGECIGEALRDMRELFYVGH